MDNYELAKTQVEVAYLFNKIERLTSTVIAVNIFMVWFEMEYEEVEYFVNYCSGVQFPAHAGAHLYRDLGFTYTEISRFIGKSNTTVVEIMRLKRPAFLLSAENTPYSVDVWKKVRSSLDRKRKDMAVFQLHAKNSVI